jgi:PPOX class probable F420-dependent enzyme
LSIPEDPWWREFIAAYPPKTAKLAVVAADGSPHVTPIWVDLDGDELVFTTAADGVKGRALRRDRRVAVCFDDERPPFNNVIVKGIADVSEDPDELLQWAARLGGRYMGADRAEEYGRRNGVPGELLVRVTPVKVIVSRDLAD